MLIFLCGILGFILILFVLSYIRHKNCLEKEAPLFVPSGKLVDVGGHRLHVFSKGVRKQGYTLVLMAGGGTFLPTLDFKGLCEELCTSNHIAIVEKSGYGFSDSGKTPRDVDTVLDETRKALIGAGIRPPYVLVPHSMSGIEALRFAQKYPDEVLGIVGLDMATPRAYDDAKISPFRLSVGRFFALIGFSRFAPAMIEESPVLKNGTLTERERALYRAASYRNTATKPMILEASAIKASAALVSSSGEVETPMLLFASNAAGTGQDQTDWREIMSEFASRKPNREYIELDCPHYVHDYETKRIAADTISFLKKLKSDKAE